VGEADDLALARQRGEAVEEAVQVVLLHVGIRVRVGVRVRVRVRVG